MIKCNEIKSWGHKCDSKPKLESLIAIKMWSNKQKL